MIQLIRSNNEAATINSMYLALKDQMTGTDNYFLFGAKSQETGKTKYFVPVSVTDTNADRYFKAVVWVVRVEVNDTPAAGLIYLGDYTYPYGYYDMTIYENNTSSNLDPDNAVKTLSKTVMNLTATNNPAVSYTEYTSNDSANDVVYITNTLEA